MFLAQLLDDPIGIRVRLCIVVALATEIIELTLRRELSELILHLTADVVTIKKQQHLDWTPAVFNEIADIVPELVTLGRWFKCAGTIVVARVDSIVEHNLLAPCCFASRGNNLYGD